MDTNERIETAKTVEVQLRAAIEETGLTLNGFQYPLIGDLNYQAEIDCENNTQLVQVYSIILLFCENRKMRMKKADVHIVPDWHRAVFVLIPYGSNG